jgi:hypothetical protein
MRRKNLRYLIDTGAKYHKVIPVLEDNGFFKDNTTNPLVYIALRPNLYSYDEYYNKVH